MASFNFPLVANRRFKGLSIVELMIALMLSLLILGGLFYVLFHSVTFYDHIREKRIALQRCETVAALLLEPLMHCGYGMPLDSSAYRSSFNAAYAPFNWAGPLSVLPMTVGAITKQNAICRIAYAVPSGVHLRGTYSMEPYDFWIQLNAPVANAGPKSAWGYKPENWILFGAIQPHSSPLAVINKAGNFLAVRAPLSAVGAVISEGDELCYFRVMEAKASGGVFYTNDHSGSGMQPRVDGVVDVRFDWDSTRALMTVSILARGDTRREKPFSKIPNNWPDVYSADLDPDVYRYVLEGVQFSMKLKNWSP